MPRIALYAGSFDPITLGHLNIIERAAVLFDEVVVAVAINVHKRPLFDADARIALIRTWLDARPELGARVKTTAFQARLLVDFAQEVGACALVRGLRSELDFTYERPMVDMNRALAPELETVFLITEPHLAHVSSSLVKEVASLGGDVSHAVPPHVAQALKARYATA